MARRRQECLRLGTQSHERDRRWQAGDIDGLLGRTPSPFANGRPTCTRDASRWSKSSSTVASVGSSFQLELDNCNLTLKFVWSQKPTLSSADAARNVSEMLRRAGASTLCNGASCEFWAMVLKRNLRNMTPLLQARSKYRNAMNPAPVALEALAALQVREALAVQGARPKTPSILVGSAQVLRQVHCQVPPNQPLLLLEALLAFTLWGPTQKNDTEKLFIYVSKIN